MRHFQYHTPITPREREVLHLIAHEYSTKQIASELYVSTETINSHRKNIKRKLDVKNTAGMVRAAFERGLMQVGQVACIAILIVLSSSLGISQTELTGLNINYEMKVVKLDWNSNNDDGEGSTADPTWLFSWDDQSRDNVSNCVQGFDYDECIPFVDDWGPHTVDYTMYDKDDVDDDETVHWEYQAFEQDIGSSCEWNNLDDAAHCSIRQSFKAKHSTPSAQHITRVEAGQNLSGNRASYAEISRIWRYNEGDFLSSAIDFGTFGVGDHRYHKNSNRTSSVTNMGYNNNYAGQPTPDVYYKFTISGDKARRVTIREEEASFVEFMYLRNSSGTVIATGSIIIIKDLHPGTYTIVMEGLPGGTPGDFHLSIAVDNTPKSSIVQGAITTDESSLCNMSALPTINNSTFSSSTILGGQFEGYIWKKRIGDSNQPFNTIHDERPIHEQYRLFDTGEMGTADVSFQRIAVWSGIESEPTEEVTIPYIPTSATAGTIALSGSNAIKEGGDPGQFISTNNGAVTPGTPSYQWQQSTTDQADNSFFDIDGAESASFNITSVDETSFFRRVITDGCGEKSDATAPIKITVYPSNGIVTGKVSTKFGGLGAPIQGVAITARPKPGLVGAVEEQTVTDASGNYSFFNLYYGAGDWDYDIIPTLTDHGFKYGGDGGNSSQAGTPTVPSTVTLQANAREKVVNYIDTTGYDISGRIVQQYEGNDYGKQSVVVKLFSVTNEGLSFTGVVDTTDFNGFYSLFAENAGLYKIIPEYTRSYESVVLQHDFTPDEATINVDREITDVNFVDDTKHLFKGLIADACGMGVGDIELTFNYEEDLMGLSPFTIDHIHDGDDNVSNDTFAIELPARVYTSVTLKITEENDDFNIDGVSALAHMNAQLENVDDFPADLSFTDTLVTIRYYPKPSIEFMGLPSAIDACDGKVLENVSLEGVPRIEESVFKGYPDFEVKIWERLGGNIACPMDTGYVTINNGGSTNGVKYPISNGTMKGEDGGKYLLQAGDPDLQAPHIINASFSAFDLENINLAAVEVQPFIVTGSISLGNSIITVGPTIPLMVLHDPPTDMGYASISSNEIISGTFRSGFVTKQGIHSFAYGKLGLKSSIGFGVQLESENYVQATAEGQITRTISEEGEAVYTLETNKEYKTSATLTGDDADLFIGVAYDQKYSYERLVEIDTNTCEFSTREAYQWAPDSIRTTFALNTLGIIADTVRLTNQRASNALLPDSEEKRQQDLILSEAISQWRQVISTNRKNKAKAIETKLRYSTADNITVNGQNAVTHTITMDTLKSSTYMNVTELEEELGINTKFETAGTGVESGASIVGFQQFIPLTVDDDANSSTDTVNSRTVTFHLEDNEALDKFSVGVYKDPVYATPVFDSNGSESSCPYDPWNPANPDIKRLFFTLSPVGDTQESNGNPAGELFKFKIKNLSSSFSTESYIVYPDFKYNVNSAKIFMNGADVQSIDILDVDYDESAEIEIIVEPSAVAEASNHTIRIRVAPACVGIDYQNSNEFEVIEFCVNFPSDCSPITLVSPTNDEIINGDDNNRINLLMRGYDLDALSKVNLKYKVTGSSDWKDGPSYNQGQLPDDPSGFQTAWNIEFIPDGMYDVYLETECGTGSIKNGSDIVTITIDRSKPSVFGTPSPVDDDYDQTQDDEISVAFTETICHGGTSGATAQLIDLYTNEVIETAISCYDNIITITDVEALTSRPASFYRVILNGVEDQHGNMADEVRWVFSVGAPSPSILACVDDLFVTNNNSNQDAINVSSYSAVAIESDGSIPAFGQTTYTAQEFIELVPGFEVTAGGDFTAQIDNCTAQNPCYTVNSSISTTNTSSADISWVINELAGCVDNIIMDPTKTTTNADIWINIDAVDANGASITIKSITADIDPNQSNEYEFDISPGESEFGIGNYNSLEGNSFKMTAVFKYGLEPSAPTTIEASIRMDPLESDF